MVFRRQSEQPGTPGVRKEQLFMSSMLGGHGRLQVMLVVCIPQILIRSAIPDERPDEPNEEQQRNYDRHDHVADLIAQVHEHRYDVIGLGQGQDADHPFEHQHQQLTGIFSFVNVVDGQTDQQFNDGDHRQQDRGIAYTLLKGRVVDVMMFGYFFKGGMLHIELVQSLEFRVQSLG